MNSADINVENFQASIDFLSNLDEVDVDRISIIGICGWGGLAIQTACIDTRIKATVAVTMYDLTRVRAKGYFDKEDFEEKRYQTRKMISEQRTIDYKNGKYKMAGGIPDVCPDDAPEFFKQYWDYYKTPRGYHKRSGNSTTGWTINALTSLLNMKLFDYADEIRSAVLVVHGEKAHSRYMGEDTFELLKGDNKELLIVPNATHCDLYDGGKNNCIPFDKIDEFIRKNI